VARYFFNQINGVFKPDDDGLEFGTLEAARIEAVRYAGEVLRDHPTLVWQGEDFRVEVTDKKKMLVFTVIVVGIDPPAGGRSTNPALDPAS
jgi:hypothetical protein